MEGTILVQLVDSQSMKTVWKGMASQNVYDLTTSETIELLVNNIFEEYPIRRDRLAKFSKKKIDETKAITKR